MWRRYRRTHANIDGAQPTTRTHPLVLNTALDECMYPCERHRSVHEKDIEEWRERWPRSSGRTGGVHVDVLCDEGVEQAMGQRSSFTEELVHRGARSQRSSFMASLTYR